MERRALLTQAGMACIDVQTPFRLTGLVPARAGAETAWMTGSGSCELVYGDLGRASSESAFVPLLCSPEERFWSNPAAF